MPPLMGGGWWGALFILLTILLFDPVTHVAHEAGSQVPDIMDHIVVAYCPYFPPVVTGLLYISLCARNTLLSVVSALTGFATDRSKSSCGHFNGCFPLFGIDERIRIKCGIGDKQDIITGFGKLFKIAIRVQASALERFSVAPFWPQ